MKRMGRRKARRDLARAVAPIEAFSAELLTAAEDALVRADAEHVSAIERAVDDKSRKAADTYYALSQEAMEAAIDDCWERRSEITGSVSAAFWDSYLQERGAKLQLHVTPSVTDGWRD